MQAINSTFNNYQISLLSDRSVLVSFGNIIDPAINKKVLLLHKTLLQSGFEGFIESVPAYASIAVFYDVIQIKKHTTLTAYAFVKNYLQQLLLQNDPLQDTEPDSIKIPVCYDEEFGPDIKQLAHDRRLSVQEVIDLHTAVVYRVYMIGFMPGFPYMGSVDEKLITPRKDQPRLHVTAGSIGIAGSQTGIYPIDSPGGWQIIGRTPIQLFDANSLPPCLLSAGDTVQFVSIEKNEFKKYRGY